MAKDATEGFWKKVSVPVTAGVILASVVGLATFFPLRETISSTWNWLLEPTTVSRLWLGILWASFLILVIGCSVVIGVAFFKSDEPAYFSYKEDRFFGLKWHWRWFSTKEGSDISNPTAFCPVCDRVMRSHEVIRSFQNSLVHFECQNCQQPVTMEGPRAEVYARVEIEIRHRVTTGKWLEIIKSKLDSPV